MKQENTSKFNVRVDVVQTRVVILSIEATDIDDAYHQASSKVVLDKCGKFVNEVKVKEILTDTKINVIPANRGTFQG